MAGEWTFETLLEHVLAKIDANDQRYQQRFLDAQTAVNTAMSAAEKAVSAALSAAKEAVIKAETASDKRFEGVNEFRATLSDQQRTLMPRSEAELRLNAMAAQLESLQKIVGERQGERRGGTDMRIAIVAIVAAVVALVSLLLRLAGMRAP